MEQQIAKRSAALTVAQAQRGLTALHSRNLTDAYCWSAVSSNANAVVRFPGQPRIHGASLTARF